MPRRALRARPPEVPEKAPLFSCFAAARAACVSTWLGELVPTFPSKKAWGPQAKIRMIKRYAILEGSWNPGSVKETRHFDVDLFRFWCLMFLFNYCLTLPSAKRPEGRAARGRPGNVWQYNYKYKDYDVGHKGNTQLVKMA